MEHENTGMAFIQNTSPCGSEGTEKNLKAKGTADGLHFFWIWEISLLRAPETC